jgi:hypothetical protein
MSGSPLRHPDSRSSRMLLDRLNDISLPIPRARDRSPKNACLHAEFFGIFEHTGTYEAAASAIAVLA